MREVGAEAKNPVMLYSIGKDSAVMLHIARKAFILEIHPSHCCILTLVGSLGRCMRCAKWLRLSLGLN